MKTLLLLSGPVASGKSLVAQELMQAHGFKRIKSSGHLLTIAARENVSSDRRGLQELGDRLDLQTDYKWVVDIAEQAINASDSGDLWLLDSVRKERQIFHFRNKYGKSVLHVHLHAPEAILRERYDERRRTEKSNACDSSYDSVIQHTNEISSRALICLADLVIDTSKTSPKAAAEEILRYRQQERS